MSEAWCSYLSALDLSLCMPMRERDNIDRYIYSTAGPFIVADHCQPPMSRCFFCSPSDDRCLSTEIQLFHCTGSRVTSYFAVSTPQLNELAAAARSHEVGGKSGRGEHNRSLCTSPGGIF